MKFVRRRFLHLACASVAVPAIARIASAQTAGPKANQVLRKDLEGQDNRVQETVVTSIEFPPGQGVAWHMHPGAQELLYGLEGSLTLEIEGHGTRTIAAGDVGIIPADRPHVARNESSSSSAKILVVHSRSDKDKPLRVDLKRPT